MSGVKKLTILHSNDLHGDFLAENIDETLIGGVSMLAGIGFTVSLFIANLSFGSMGVHGHELLNDAKLGILVGSLLSGLLGYTYLSRVLPKSVEEDED